MDEPKPSRRQWFDLPTIAMLAFLAAIASLAAWKWSQSHNRHRCELDLCAKGVMIGHEPVIDVWSGEWPFHNAERWVGIVLGDGTYDHDDVLRLRRTFPGVPIYHDELTPAGTFGGGPRELLPED
jgi:hypothetical protein